MTETEALPIVYIWPDSQLPTGDLGYVVMADDGEVLKTHICSSATWARHDCAGEDFGSLGPYWPQVRQLYVDKFGGWGDGEFYRVEWSRPPEWAIRAHHERKAAANGHTLRPTS